MEVPMVRLVRQEICEGDRWVRFGKRTHRRGILVGFGCADSTNTGRLPQTTAASRRLGSVGLGFQNEPTGRGFGGVWLPQTLHCGVSSDSALMKSDLLSRESKPPEGGRLWFFVRFVRSCDSAALSVVSARRWRRSTDFETQLTRIPS